MRTKKMQKNEMSLEAKIKKSLASRNGGSRVLNINKGKI